MIPDPKKTEVDPKSVVIDILSTKPRLTMREIEGFFKEKYKKGMTTQGLYRIVRQLIKDRVLVREAGLMSIDASWIYNLRRFSDLLERVYFGQNSATVSILLREGESRTFDFESPDEMDNFWTHALIVVTQYYINEKHENKNVYVFVDHPWFQLIKTKQEQILNDLYKTNKMILYQIVGKDLFLDKVSLGLIDKSENVYVSIDLNSSFGNNSYKMVIGDFLFETKLPPHIYDEFEKVYQKTDSMDKFNPNDLISLIRQRNRTSLTIFRNKNKAEEFRSSIEKIGQFQK